MNLTTAEYWGQRQKSVKHIVLDKSIAELIDVILPFIDPGSKFIELGCSPGIISAFLGKKKNLKLYGVDFSPESDLYIKNVFEIYGEVPILYNCDLLEFRTENQFDIVASFGLIEHFLDPLPVIKKHYDLCKSEGIIIITVPNFRYIQYLYHFLFDKRDLKVHNTKVMSLEYFQMISKIFKVKTLLLGHFGTINFWNFDNYGFKFYVTFRKLAAKSCTLITNKVLSKLLPSNNKYYSPWIIYVGRKT